jgi:hypothetical protein
MKKYFRGILWFFDIMLLLSGVVNLAAYFEGSFSEYTSPVISIILGVILLRYLRNSNGKKESAVDSKEISSKSEVKKTPSLLKSSVGNIIYTKLDQFASKATEEGIEKVNCAICKAEIRRMNKPLFGQGNLNDGNEICTDCHGKMDVEDVRKFSSTEVKLIFLGEKSPGEIVKERLKTEMGIETAKSTEATQNTTSVEPDSNNSNDVSGNNDESKPINKNLDNKKWFLKKALVLPTLSIVLILLIFRSCGTDQTLPGEYFGTYYGDYSETGDMSITINKDGTFTTLGITGDWKVKARPGDNYRGIDAFWIQLVLPEGKHASKSNKKWLTHKNTDNWGWTYQDWRLIAPFDTNKPGLTSVILTHIPGVYEIIKTRYYFRMR